MNSQIIMRPFRLMRLAALTALVTVALVSNAKSQCCGDCDGDGRVRVTELVTAVNNALHECTLSFDVRTTFLDSSEVQACTTHLTTAGFTPGNVEATGPISSFCDTSRCEVTVLAIQHFGREAEGRSIGALVTYQVSGGPDQVEVLATPPFDACNE